MIRRTMAMALGLAAAPALAQHQDHANTLPAAAVTQLVAGHGNGGFAIATRDAGAQAFFDNGIELAFAFEHRAASAAFAEAVRRDPACVMCAWGAAWAAGPTINYTIKGADLVAAQRLAADADRLARRGGTPLERALTRALVARYRDGGGEGQKGDRAFARAMERIGRTAPANDTLATMAADATLNTMAADDDEAAIRAKARRAMRQLVPILARNPNHSGAVHFYIHASEIGGLPGHATPFADRLGALAPRSQHLVHMPSHTFYWVGRYRDAGRVNLAAVRIGEEVAARGSAAAAAAFAQRYHAHNVAFGLGGALIAGDAPTALAIARPLVALTHQPAGDPREQRLPMRLGSVGLIALGLFAPDELLALGEPRTDIQKAMWRYARGELFAARGDSAALKAEVAAAPRPAIPAPTPTNRADWLNATTAMIAANVLDGRLAAIEGRHADALAAYARAVELEEGPAYSQMMDPPWWWYPVRRDLAELRYRTGDVAGARREAVATLARRPLEPVTSVLLARIDGVALAAK